MVPALGGDQIVSRNHEFELILGLPGFLCCFSDFCGCSAVVRPLPLINHVKKSLSRLLEHVHR